MQVIARIVLFLFKYFSLFYYVGKKPGKEVMFSFGKDVTFYTRRGSNDAFILFEVWKKDCYKASIIERGSIVVDIGAHIGAYSILAAKKGAKVIAYEADSDNYRFLVKNLRKNSLTSVIARNKAVSSKNGTITFYVNKKGTGLNSIHAYSSGLGKSEVASVDLHKVLTENKLDKIDVLKIDTEGAEYSILLNARREDLRRIKLMVFEYHDYIDHGHKCAELKKMLRDNGFSVRTISPWHTQLMKSGVILAKRI